MADRGHGPIGYLSSRYPAVSHTFVMREVNALRRRGVDVHTMSIHRAPVESLLTDADREAERTTFAVLPASAGRLLLAHAEMFARSPRRYLGTLAFALQLSPPGLRGRLWQLFYFAEAMILARHCRRAGVRHIHAQFADVATDVAMLVSHHGGPGWTWSLAVHGPVEFYDVSRVRLREKLEHAEFAQAISDFGRSQLMTLAEEERWERFHVVHCGIEPDVYRPAPPPDRGDGELRIICVGRLVHLKGQSVLVDAVAELERRGVPARAIFIGDGPSREKLRSRAESQGVGDRVELLGSVGQNEIRDHYAAADVFCLPSFAEGVPVVLMEAMALERPVVTTRIMGIPELVDDGVSGLLVRPGRADLLADALERLASDPARRAEMGRAGREKVVAEYDVDLSAGQLADIFAGLAR